MSSLAVTVSLTEEEPQPQPQPQDEDEQEAEDMEEQRGWSRGGRSPRLRALLPSDDIHAAGGPVQPAPDRVRPAALRRGEEEERRGTHKHGAVLGPNRRLPDALPDGSGGGAGRLARRLLLGVSGELRRGALVALAALPAPLPRGLHRPLAAGPRVLSRVQVLLCVAHNLLS